MLEVVVPLAGAEIHRVPVRDLGSLPGIQVEPLRHFFLLAHLPDLFHGPADDLHELIAEHKAYTHGNEQGEHNAGDYYAQVLEMLEKRFLFVLVRFIAQLKYFFQHKHATDLKSVSGGHYRAEPWLACL